MRGAERDAAIRAELRPLGPTERPLALTLAVVLAAVLAVAVLLGALTLHGLGSRGGSLIGGVFLAGVLASLAVGMWRRRYGAVLGFEALLAFQVVVTALALTVAATWWAALLCVASIGLAGTLFWKLVRVMGRLQTPSAQTAR